MRLIPIALICIFAFLLFYLMNSIPAGFIPQEDSGTAMGMITLPPGSSMERTEKVMKEVMDSAKTLPNVMEVAGINGVNFMSEQGSSYASVVIKLEPWEDRKINVNKAVAMMFQKTSHITNASFLFFGTPTIQGFGLGNGVSLELEDRTGGDINVFYEVTGRFLESLNQQPEIQYATTTFNPNFPQKLLTVDMAKVKDAGITLSELMMTLQIYIGSYYGSNFNLYGKQFRVMLQALPEYRANEEDLNGIYVSTASGAMAPVTEFITISDITGPQALTRFNLYSAMDVTIVPQPNASTGDIISIVSRLAEQNLPDGYTYEYSGISREEANSSSQTTLIFIVCLVFVYLLLSALYESYVLPLSILLSLPVGLSGVYIFIYFGLFFNSGIVNNIYVQIAVVMLIGLLAKNAILIVEYAIQRRRQGMSIVDSAIQGAEARLRPILMTSFALIFGLLPLAVSSGAGAIGNKSIGIAAIGGMLIGTAVGVFVIPVLFIIFQSLQEKFSKKNSHKP